MTAPGPDADVSRAPAVAEASHAEPGAIDLEGPILLFDGVCSLCSGFVRFVIERDRKRRFRFASLQSGVAGSLLERVGLEPQPEDPEAWSVVLIEGGRAHERSSAALRTARRLGRAWPLVGVMLLVPRPVRDIVYRFVARHRYRWFGRTDACYLPDADESWRFLDAAES